MKLTNFTPLSPQRLTGTWYRAIQPKHWKASLSTAHTRTISSRFSAGTMANPSFEVLYLAEDHQVALFEVQALLGSPLPGGAYAPNPAQTWVIVNVDVTLSNVADLCRRKERKKVQTTVQELTGDWRGYALRNPGARPTAPTQRLGSALNGVRDLEGFLTFSAKVPTRKSLVVFPQKLQAGSRIRFRYFDPHTLTTETQTITP
ncbi:MAG: RES family NAD+ phosphorylase [Pirellulales bacterium]